MNSSRGSSLPLVLAGALATVGLHALAFLVYFPESRLGTFAYLVAGWATFAATCYGIGRMRPAPAAIPSARPADVGVALFLFSVVVAGALDSWGIAPETAPEAYLLPAIGVYVGLALVGWALGRRSRVIDRIAHEG